MKTYIVECQAPHEPCYSETVQALDAKAAKKIVAAHAQGCGFHPTRFRVVELSLPGSEAVELKPR